LFILQIIDSLVQHKTTPLIVKKAICAFFSVGWKVSVDRYRRIAAATAKRALDASDCTVARKKQCASVDETDEAGS
jgi:hypothetical protein